MEQTNPGPTRDRRSPESMRTPELVREYTRHRVHAAVRRLTDETTGPRVEADLERLSAVVAELIRREVLD